MALGRKLTAEERARAAGTPIHGAASKIKSALGGGKKPVSKPGKTPSSQADRAKANDARNAAIGERQRKGSKSYVDTSPDARKARVMRAKALNKGVRYDPLSSISTKNGASGAKAKPKTSTAKATRSSGKKKSKKGRK